MDGRLQHQSTMRGQLTRSTPPVTTSQRQPFDVVDVGSLLLGLELADAINRLGQAIAEQTTAARRAADMRGTRA